MGKRPATTYEEWFDCIIVRRSWFYNLREFDLPQDEWEPPNLAHLAPYYLRALQEFPQQARALGKQAAGKLAWGLMRPEDTLWHETVRMEDRLACITAMKGIFLDYVANEDTEGETAYFMWWDGLISDRHVNAPEKRFPKGGQSVDQMLDACAPYVREYWRAQALAGRNGKRYVSHDFRQHWWDAPYPQTDALRVDDHLLATLEELLRSDCEKVQYSALHGIGHLYHPRGAEVVTRFLQRRDAQGPYDGYLKAYAMDCAEGSVM